MMQDFHGPCQLNLCFLGRLFNTNSSKNTTLLLAPDIGGKKKLITSLCRNFAVLLSYWDYIAGGQEFFFFVATLSV